MIKLLNTKITGRAPVDENILFEMIIEKHKTSGLRLIRDRWAGADELIFNLIIFLNSLKSSTEDKLLVQKCVDEGVKVWNTLGDESDEKSRVAAFIRGSIYFLPEVLDWRVVWLEKPRTPQVLWNPYEDGLTQAWRAQGRQITCVLKGGPKPEWASVSEEDFRSIILTKHLINDSTLMRSMAPQLGYLAGR